MLKWTSAASTQNNATLSIILLAKPQKLPIPQLGPESQIINTPKLSSFDSEYFEMRLEGKI